MERAKKITLAFEKPLRDLEDQLVHLRTASEGSHVDVSSEIQAMEAKIEATKRDIYSNLGAWEKVLLARHPERPYSLDYIESIFDDFQEIHGDRAFRDDRSIVGGTALLQGKAVMVIGQQKGRSTKENILRNFGCPNPEGYRKALRLMKLADKFGLPIITLIDTPGAYPGIGSEERHVAEAIAVNIKEMSRLGVPIVSVIIGEGGSGGALGMAMANEVLIMENAYYSVISPEGCAAILWKDRVHAPKAAEALQITAPKLLKLGIVDSIIEEPLGGAQVDSSIAKENLKESILGSFEKLKHLDQAGLLEHRYAKYRKIGVFEESEQNKIVEMGATA